MTEEQNVNAAEQVVGTQDQAAAEAVEGAEAKPTNHITIDDFAKVEMKIGKVLSAERIEGSDKLLKLSVDFAEEKPRQVLSGIGKFVTPEELVSQIFPFVTNLPPRKMMGLESQAMILAASDESGLGLLKPSIDLKPGTHLS